MLERIFYLGLIYDVLKVFLMENQNKLLRLIWVDGKKPFFCMFPDMFSDLKK